MTFDASNQTKRHFSPYTDQIDAVCDDFEAAWQQGSRLRIENCLRLVPDAARGQLLRELLEIEVEIRVQNHESVLFEQYATRFPEHTDLIKGVLQRHTGRRRLGDYELLEQLGRGGMGIVYKARQVYLNQIVAIKILLGQYGDDDHALSRFRREMQLIGGLKHPNIVQAYNAGEADGTHFLVMEYVAGVTLQRLIAERASGFGLQTPGWDRLQTSDSGFQESASNTNPEARCPKPEVLRGMPIGAACEAIRQAALGLHHAHQRGLVHRDIKPGNLMLDRHGLIKVLDLGLGKFQADVLQGDRSMGPLTQAGTTMGTVDYMAPEQWDDPTTVDIRADIYSLGNTLYFLLCGTPPFDGKNYESNRAKLMAHIVAEPPSLQKACAGVPTELEAIYMKMSAKEARYRYQTPLEAAEALAPFADADALREAIPQVMKHISDADHATSSEYEHSAGRDTIASYPYSPSRRRRMTDFAPPRKSWYRSQGFYSGIALFNIALLVAAITLFSRLGRDNPAVPPVEPNHNGTDYELRFDPTERNAMIADLLELPGLSGATWYLEMPWFTPFVRKVAADMLLQTTKPETLLGNNMKGYLDPDTVEVQKWLWALTRQTLHLMTPPQQKLVNDLKDLADSNLELDEYADRIETALGKFVEDNANLPPNPSRRAVDANTEAMLLHTLSGLKVDKDLAGFADKANDRYQEALNAYGTDTVSQQLKLLCMTDMARLIGQTLNKYDESQSLYDAVRNDDRATNLLKAEVLISLGVDLAAQGQAFEHHFRNAESLLKDPKNKIHIGNSHPLFAHIAERHAWCLIDRWEVDKAKTLFSLALSIRDANSRDGQNPFADIYVLHNKHGLAMTTRFRGDTVAARQLYDEVIGVIAKKLADAEILSQEPDLLPGQLRYLRELRERLVNSQYRRADCELFSGAASADGSIQLAKAEEWYKPAREMTNDRATQLALSVKLCLIQTLLGKTDEANESLSVLNPAIEDVVSPDARYRTQRFADVIGNIIAIRRAAEMAAAKSIVATGEPSAEALAAHQQEIAKLRTKLQQIARDATLASTDPARSGYNNNRPEMLEFRLFCIEFLLNAEKKFSERSGNSSLSQAGDIKLLIDALAVFKDKPGMTPYARRYYDLALQVADKSDDSDVAQLVALMQLKMGPLQGYSPGNDVGEAWHLLFQFSPTDNFVVLECNGNDPAMMYRTLTLTREQIHEAANRRQEITPQPELREILELVRNARVKGRIINIYWDDSPCWGNEKDALTDADWPFKKLLPLQETE